MPYVGPAMVLRARSVPPYAGRRSRPRYHPASGAVCDDVIAAIPLANATANCAASDEDLSRTVRVPPESGLFVPGVLKPVPVGQRRLAGVRDARRSLRERRREHDVGHHRPRRGIGRLPRVDGPCRALRRPLHYDVGHHRPRRGIGRLPAWTARVGGPPAAPLIFFLIYIYT